MFTIEDIFRFASKIDTKEALPCWRWTANKNLQGYGLFWFKRKNIAAHRISYLMTIGPINKGMCVCHTCDNPWCVNPNHLFLGTNKDNTRDMITKNRHHAARIKECPSGHEYSKENTRIDGKGWRKCLMCESNLERSAKRKKQKKEYYVKNKEYILNREKAKREKTKTNSRRRPTSNIPR